MTFILKYLPSHLFRVFFVFILTFSLFSCQVVDFFLNQSPNIQSQEHLRLYLENVPQDESLNASIYNYELITKAIASNIARDDNEEALRHFIRYLNTFFESEPDDQSHIYYLAAKTIKNLLQMPDGRAKIDELANQDQNFRQFLRTRLYSPYETDSKSEVTKRAGLVIVNSEINKSKKLNEARFFWQVLLMRENYLWERAAFREVFFANLLPVKQKSDYRHNFNYLYWSISRYPDLLDYEEVLQNSLFFPRRLETEEGYVLSGNREKIDRIKAILQSFKPVQSFKKNILAFAYPYGVILRNRAHKITSRNVRWLEAWEPFFITALHKGEDGEIWFRVEVGKEKWFLPTDALFLMPKNEQSEELALTYSTISLTDQDMEEYLKCHQLFQQQDYIGSVDCILQDTDRSLESKGEFFIILFYKNLKAIGERSTSMQNVYMDFVKRYPRYFVADEKGYNLYPSGFLLDKLLSVNSHSTMLQYFDSIEMTGPGEETGTGGKNGSF